MAEILVKDFKETAFKTLKRNAIPVKILYDKKAILIKGVALSILKACSLLRVVLHR